MKKLLYILFVILAVQSCRDDDCPVAPDPCSEYPEKIEIIVSKESLQRCNPRNIPLGGYDLYSIDTFHTIGLLLFEINYNYDSVRWQFGNDPRLFSQSSLIFNFDDPVGEVLISAIAYRSISYECFGPEDDGIDTIQKSIYILSRDDAPIWGTYSGVNDNETDSFNVTIGRDTIRRDGNLWYEDYYQGLPKGSNEKHGNMFVDWHRMYSTGSPASTSPDGLRRCHIDANLDSNNTDLITINWRHNNDRETDRTFKGVRIK